MRYVWASASHVGHVRVNNEDSVLPADDGAAQGPVVIAVADGMGGAVGGEIASKLAIEAVTDTDGTPADRARAANRAVLQRIADDPDLHGMGTTLTMAILTEDGTAEIAHVGDSRGYVQRIGELEQITDDHSVVMEMVRIGQLTPAQAANHPRRHMITRVIGMTDVDVDELTFPLAEGDRLLLCSDGLTDQIPDTNISMVLRTAPTPSDAAWSLVEAANRAGGIDNTTVVVVDVVADE